MIRESVLATGAAPERIAAGELHVWWWKTPDDTDPAGLDLLSADEQRRVAKMRKPQTIADFVTGRIVVRRILAELLGVTPGEIVLGRLPCPDCGDLQHGPPSVVSPETPLRISLSCTAGCGVLAVAGFPIGVDVEGHRSLDVDLLGSVVLTPRERTHVLGRDDPRSSLKAFYRCWTRKEAILKAVGIGIVAPMNRLDVRPDISEPVTVRAGVNGVTRPWRIQDLSLAEPWTAAIAYPAGTSATVRLEEVDP
ncbi:4'-phosphopantetheinyl transferase family protein [Streptomyces xanthophaeus]|uniref:4'-phosphopantetheinyl transferase family protein n=1 Tax=Streptomyces xanthophaeus TaxID=67385 RepID=UPI00399014C9